MLMYPLLIWVLFAVVTILTVVFRETTLIPRVGEPTAQITGTAILVVTILGVSGIYFVRTAIDYRGMELVLVGVLWFLLSAHLGFVLGRLFGIPFSRAVVHFTGTVGPGWIPVAASLVLAPWLFGGPLRAQLRRPTDAD